MAQIQYAVGISEVIGALNKKNKCSDSFVQRRKHFYGPNGDVTWTGRIEAYIIKNPRNFKLKPAHGAELAHQTLFGEVSKEANSLLRAVKNNNATSEQMAQYENFVQRYYAQLKGIPDPFAPKDNKGKGKIYGAFNCFVRTMMYYERLNQ